MAVSATASAGEVRLVATTPLDLSAPPAPGSLGTKPTPSAPSSASPSASVAPGVGGKADTIASYGGPPSPYSPSSTSSSSSASSPSATLDAAASKWDPEGSFRYTYGGCHPDLPTQLSAMRSYVKAMLRERPSEESVLLLRQLASAQAIYACIGNMHAFLRGEIQQRLKILDHSSTPLTTERRKQLEQEQAIFTHIDYRLQYFSPFVVYIAILCAPDAHMARRELEKSKLFASQVRKLSEQIARGEREDLFHPGRNLSSIREFCATGGALLCPNGKAFSEYIAEVIATGVIYGYGVAGYKSQEFSRARPLEDMALWAILEWRVAGLTLLPEISLAWARRVYQDPSICRTTLTLEAVKSPSLEVQDVLQRCRAIQTEGMFRAQEILRSVPSLTLLDPPSGSCALL